MGPHRLPAVPPPELHAVYTTDQREHFREVAERVKAGWSSFPRLVPDCYPPEVFARGEALLAAAASATGDSAVARERVRGPGDTVAPDYCPSSAFPVCETSNRVQVANR